MCSDNVEQEHKANDCQTDGYSDEERTDQFHGIALPVMPSTIDGVPESQSSDRASIVRMCLHLRERHHPCDVRNITQPTSSDVPPSAKTRELLGNYEEIPREI